VADAFLRTVCCMWACTPVDGGTVRCTYAAVHTSNGTIAGLCSRGYNTIRLLKKRIQRDAPTRVRTHILRRNLPLNRRSQPCRVVSGCTWHDPPGQTDCVCVAGAFTTCLGVCVGDRTQVGTEWKVDSVAGWEFTPNGDIGLHVVWQGGVRATEQLACCFETSDGTLNNTLFEHTGATFVNRALAAFLQTGAPGGGHARPSDRLTTRSLLRAIARLRATGYSRAATWLPRGVPQHHVFEGVRTQHIRWHEAGGFTLVASVDIQPGSAIAMLGLSDDIPEHPTSESWCKNEAELGKGRAICMPPTYTHFGVLINSAPPGSGKGNSVFVRHSSYHPHMKVKARRLIKKGDPVLLNYGRGAVGWTVPPSQSTRTVSHRKHRARSQSRNSGRFAQMPDS
jgi:hypothetical protein